MKKFAVLAITAATLGFAVPASAQVSVGVGDHGVGVRIGDDHRGDRGRYYEGRRHRMHVADCRVIKERTVTPRGRVIVETRRVCD